LPPARAFTPRAIPRTSDNFIPMTPKDMAMRSSAGRVMMNYTVASNRLDYPEIDLPEWRLLVTIKQAAVKHSPAACRTTTIYRLPNMAENYRRHHESET